MGGGGCSYFDNIVVHVKVKLFLQANFIINRHHALGVGNIRRSLPFPQTKSPFFSQLTETPLRCHILLLCNSFVSQPACQTTRTVVPFLARILYPPSLFSTDSKWFFYPEFSWMPSILMLHGKQHKNSPI